MKKANARKFAFRKGLDDKRTRAQGQYGGGDDDEEERSEASAAADGGAPKGAVEPSGDGIAKVDDQDKDAQGLEAGKDGRLTPHQLRALESLAKPEMWQSPAEASAGGKDVSADVAEIVELLKKIAQQGEKK